MNPQIDITDSALAQAIRDELIIGSAFAFLNAKAFRKPQLLWVSQLFGQYRRSHTLPLLGYGSLDLPSCRVHRSQLPQLHMRSITSDRNLYKPSDPVYLLLVNLTGRSSVVSVRANSVETERFPVEFSARGAATLVLRGLTTGEYSISVACELREALTRSDISSIEVLEGTVLVEVHRIVEVDWSRFASNVQVRVSLEQNGQARRSFTTAETLNLRVQLQDGYQTGDLVWVCLPEALSRLVGGGQVKLFSIDFKGNQEVSIPLVTTSVTVNQDGQPGLQHFCVCVRNMFEEERVGNPGPLELSVTAATDSKASGGWLSGLKRLFQ